MEGVLILVRFTKNNNIHTSKTKKMLDYGGSGNIFEIYHSEGCLKPA